MFYCSFTVCSDLNFCPHTNDLIDMRQGQRESNNHLFILLQIVGDDPVQHC